MFQKQIYGFGNKINHKYGFTKNHVVFNVFSLFSNFGQKFRQFRIKKGFFFIVLTFDVKLCF